MKKTGFRSNLLLRYVNAGIISLLFEFSVLISLTEILNISAIISVTIAFWLTLVVSFVLQKFLAFQDYKKTIKVLSGQIVAFFALVFFNYFFTIYIVSLFPENLVLFSRLLALGFVTVWNYFIFKYLFSSEEKRLEIRKYYLSSIYIKKVSQSIFFVFLLSLPIIGFLSQYLFSGQKIIIGDFDYYAQIYEAFRITILHYNQFPAWDPWLSGGIPLFNNPQFGLFSIQSVFVILFGTALGLKIAYVLYSIIGFWGIYILGRKVLNASKFRSALGGYLWVFGAFFAAHNISHYTFALFFLIPWIFYFIATRKNKRSWLWLGITISLITLSSLHYAFLMTSISIGIFLGYCWLIELIQKKKINFSDTVLPDLKFIYKTLSVVLILAGYRVITTYLYLSSNERPNVTTFEDPPSLLVMLQSIFLPYDTFLNPPKTYWGWWEYTSYIGLGASLALGFCLASAGYMLYRKKGYKNFISAPSFVFPVILLGLTALMLALGEFAHYSPYSLLKQLPGFSETRVSSRWAIFVIFMIIVFLMSWKKHKNFINILLLVAVVELFISYGPFRMTGDFFINAQDKTKSFGTFQQYDNGYSHDISPQTIDKSYYYSTSKNIGQIYGDDSIVNTLNRVLGTKRCGYNIDTECDFVLTNNADLTFWSPNRVELKRTSGGEIKLNMNRDKGWRVNNSYIYRDSDMLDPNIDFILPEGSDTYTLIYSPKFSPTWIIWRVDQDLQR